MDTTFTKIFDRISEALNFFDFSFIVSGLMTLGIIYCSISNYYTFDLSGYSKTVIIIAAIVMVYVSGLVSFSIGKWLRLKILYIGNKEYFNKVFCNALSFVNSEPYFKSEEFSKYLDIDKFDNTKYKSVYSKMWLDLRHSEEAKETMRHLNRFWMMQAVYEGLFTSSIVAIIASSCLICKSPVYFIIMVLLSVICMVFCYIEARRYAETQILEIVIAYKKFIAL